MKAHSFLPTSQLLQTDGVLLSRPYASTPEPTSGMLSSSGAPPRRTGSAGVSRTATSGGSGGVGGGGLHDNYLTGGVVMTKVALFSSGAQDPGDLHQLPKQFVSAQQRLGQVTGAARSCSGELVQVPQLGAHRGNISATHPSVDGGQRYDRHFMFRGHAEPTARTIVEEHDATIRGEVEAAQSAAAKAAQIHKWATIIQSLARMRQCRRRYLEHRRRLTALLERVFWEQQNRCAIYIQRNTRRMLARYKYLRMREALWQKHGAAGINGGGGGGKGAKKGGLAIPKPMAPPTPSGGGAKAVVSRRSSMGASTVGPRSLPQEPYPWMEGIAERNFTFVVALKSMISGKLEEAKHAFETFSSQSGGDKVALRLAYCCESRLRSIAALAAGRDAGAGGSGAAGADKKGAAGAKGGAAAKKATPARKR